MPVVDAKLELRHDDKLGIVGTTMPVVDAKLELRHDGFGKPYNFSGFKAFERNYKDRQ